MRVLHVTPSIERAYGGPTYSLAAFARTALNQGAELTIAAPAPRAEDKWLASVLPEVEVHAFRTLGRGAFLASPSLHKWIRSNGPKFDAVHVHGLLNPVSSLATRTCVQNGWPVIVRPFGTMSRYTYAHRRGALKQAYRAMLDRPNLQRASAMHFTTDVERAESAWQKIEWGERAFVVPPPWIDDAPAAARPSVQSRTVLFFSRLHPVKRVEMLLDAWPEVQRRVPKAHLIVAGDGTPAYARSLRMRAEKLEANITFAGFVEGEKKHQLLRDAAVFVLPSLHENFGIAVLEALAAGLPVVVTSEVQLSTFVREQSLGRIADSTAESLAASIVSTLEDNNLRERCRTQGGTLAARYFSPAAIGPQLLDMYRFAVAHPPA